MKSAHAKHFQKLVRCNSYLGPLITSPPQITVFTLYVEESQMKKSQMKRSDEEITDEEITDEESQMKKSLCDLFI
jgi:hypothetical protein